MASRLTEPEIFEAADSLLAQGLRPTIERVRQALGRGSPNTVNRVLDDWWATLSKRMGNKPQALPPALEQACLKLLATMRTEAAAEAGAEVAAAKTELEKAKTTLLADRAKLESEVAGISRLVSDLREDLGKVTDANRLAVQAQARSEADLAAECQKTGRLEREASQMAQTHEKVEMRLQRDLDRQRTQSQAAENKWLTEIDRLRDELKRQRTEAASYAKASQGRLEKAEAKILELEKALATARTTTTCERERRIATEAQLSGKTSVRRKRTAPT